MPLKIGNKLNNQLYAKIAPGNAPNAELNSKLVGNNPQSGDNSSFDNKWKKFQIIVITKEDIARTARNETNLSFCIDLTTNKGASANPNSIRKNQRDKYHGGLVPKSVKTLTRFSMFEPNILI